MKSIQQISQLLSKAAIKPSLQRVMIYEYLLKNNIHPNIDKVYSALCGKIPTLSKTTVYNTLKLFERSGLVKSLKIDEHEIRYDAMKHIHGHFQCEKCGQIFDFNYNYEQIIIEELDRFDIKQTDLNLSGICPKCKQL